jgi:hypothetical protein
MKRIYVPSASPLAWKALLAQPELHWKAGYSAMTLARCWEEAAERLPREIQRLLDSDPPGPLSGARLLLAFPEYCVPLPGGSTATQTDVFAIVRGAQGLGVLAVEGKVDEEFGPTVESKAKAGAADRLKYLHELLSLAPTATSQLRYQLVHRTAAAILLAQEFGATAAAMIVHSFSPSGMWYSDFEAFVRAFGADPAKERLIPVGERAGIALFLGWATGDERFRSGLEQAAV